MASIESTSVKLSRQSVEVLCGVCDCVLTSLQGGDALEGNFKLVRVGKVGGVVKHRDVCDGNDTHDGDV